MHSRLVRSQSRLRFHSEARMYGLGRSTRRSRPAVGLMRSPDKQEKATQTVLEQAEGAVRGVGSGVT